VPGCNEPVTVSSPSTPAGFWQIQPPPSLLLDKPSRRPPPPLLRHCTLGRLALLWPALDGPCEFTRYPEAARVGAGGRRPVSPIPPSVAGRDIPDGVPPSLFEHGIRPAARPIPPAWMRGSSWTQLLNFDPSPARHPGRPAWQASGPSRSNRIAATAAVASSALDHCTSGGPGQDSTCPCLVPHKSTRRGPGSFCALYKTRRQPPARP